MLQPFVMKMVYEEIQMKKLITLGMAICLAFGMSVTVNATESTMPVSVASEENQQENLEALQKELERREILSALYEADIETLRKALDAGVVTSRELTTYYMERISVYNSNFNCFITICDNVWEEADKRDAQIAAGTAKGKLFGIPVVIKDNMEYAGYYTTNGYSFKKSKISTKNAAVVQHLLDEGAVIIGKTNMSTQAQDARRSFSGAVGNTYNAYNPDMAPGGSSGGSAVATSLNFATASLGTDTNSSLRYPAALNGCVSLRPTLGLIEKEGLIILNSRRDTAGAITRTVKDQAIMLSVIKGDGNYEENLNSNALEGVRIGVLKEFVGANSTVAGRTENNIDSEVMMAFQGAILELQMCGAEIVEVFMPDIFKMAAKCGENVSGWQAAKDNFYARYQKMFADNNISAVIFPTYLNSPLYLKNVSNFYGQTYITNCNVLSSVIGVPEVSVPIGVHSRGAGIGMEIAALRYDEQLLLNYAYSYTEKFNYRQIPSLTPDIYEIHAGRSLEDFILIRSSDKKDS